MSGSWYNAGGTAESGVAEVELIADGRPTGAVQRIAVGPIGPGATLGYQARFDTSQEGQGHVITASAVWRP